MKGSRKLYKKGGIIWRLWLYNWVKKASQWGESHEKVVSHRPLWTRASTVVNTSNDRYEHEQRSMRHDFLNDFPRFLTCFRTTFTRFSGCYYHNISEQIFWVWVLEDGARRPPSYFKIPWLLFILGVVIIKQEWFGIKKRPLFLAIAEQRTFVKCKFLLLN